MLDYSGGQDEENKSGERENCTQEDQDQPKLMPGSMLSNREGATEVKLNQFRRQQTMQVANKNQSMVSSLITVDDQEYKKAGGPSFKKAQTKFKEFLDDGIDEEGPQGDQAAHHLNESKRDSILKSQFLGDSSIKQDDDSDDEKLQLQANDDEAQDEELQDNQMQSVGGTNHTENMKNFINNYGIELKIPSFYLLDTKVYPKDTTLSLQVIQYTMTKNKFQQEYKIKTFKRDGSAPITQNLGDVYGPGKFCCNKIKLVRSSGGHQQTLSEIKVRGSKKVTLCFSPDGEYLALLMKKVNNLFIFKIGDDLQEFMNKIGQQIEDESLLIHSFINNQFLQKSKVIEFDQTGQFLIIYGSFKSAVIDIHDQDNPIIEKFKYDIKQNDEDRFNYIMGVQVYVDPDQDDEIRVDVACKARQQKKVHILTLANDEIKERVIIYQNELQDWHLKISNDCSKVVFAHQTECYILEKKSSSKNIFSQTSLTMLKNRQIKAIVPAGQSEFLFICCKPYDTDIDILSSKDEKFKLGIKRQIEPGSLKVFDAFQQNLDEDQPYGERLNLATLIDGDLYLDIVNPLSHKQNLDQNIKNSNNNLEQEIIDSSVSLETQGFNTNWPYITFKGIENYMFLIDANKRTINRIELPEDMLRVRHSYITDTMDMYILVEFEEYYYVYRVNLDNYEDGDRSKQRFELKELFYFSKTRVENKELLDFHVRASSEKSSINLNKKTVALMLFKGMLYCWTQGVNNNDSEKDSISELTDTISYSIQKQNDDVVIIGQEEIGKQNKKLFKLIQITIEFTSCIPECLYFESQQLEIVQTYKYDFSANILLLLKRDAKKKRKKNGKTLSLIDLKDENKKLYEARVFDRNLIGRLKTNLFKFIDGHIYFNDQIIKIRYDLLKNQKSARDLSEYEVMDYYDDILNLSSGKKVQIKFPIHIIKARRVIYLIKDQKNFTSKSILILPFLHERRIILQHCKPECEYFNTSFVREEDGVKSINLITMNITEKKFYVYSLRGLLKNRHDFGQFAKQYGKPKAVSNDGLKFIFKKSNDFDLHIVQMNQDSLQYVSTINIQTDVLESPDMTDQRELIKDHFGDLEDPKKVKQFFQISDNMDVAVQLISKPEAQKIVAKGKLNKMNSKVGSQIFKEQDIDQQQIPNIFYFQRGPKSDEFRQSIEGGNTLQSIIFKSKKNYKQQICFTTLFEKYKEFFEVGVDGFSINKSYIFFWNHYNIWYLPFHDEEPQMKKLGLVVDPEELQTWIKCVRTGSDWKKIAVIVKQSKTQDSSIVWSVENDNELNQFDHGLNPRVFWDRNGDAYVTEENKVFNCEMGVALNCYDVQTINEHDILESKKQQFGYHQGHKFDSDGHSWIFLREQISLSFCYMTFVLNKKTKEKQSYQLKDYLFDRQQYDYIIDRRTALSDRDLIGDPQKLSYILKKFEETDPGLLEQLQHYYELNGKRVTPLHIAWELQNYSINIILKYMARLEYSQFENFKDLWHKLVDYKTFQDFLYEQTFQTLQMQNKQTIRMPYKHSDSIVCIQKAYSSYVDENYFKYMMKEDKSADHNSFPVKVVALEVGWILTEPKEGKKFLQAILQSENNALYDNYATESLIEFLFENYKKEAFRKFPLYLFRLIVYLFTIYFHEQFLLDQEVKSHDKQDLEQSVSLLTNAVNHSLLIGLNTVGCVIVAYQMIRLTFNSKETYWRSNQAVLDLAYLILNGAVTIGFIIELPIKILRVIQAVLSLAVWFKFMYYLQISYYFSNLITIIGQIFMDIGWFLLLFIVLIFMFSNAFFLLGQNQIQFDQLRVDDGEGNDEMPLYAESLIGSLQYIFMLSLGELGVDQFEKGQGTQTPYLWILFIISSFALIVHMLNMLIAIMGETFANSNEVQYQTKLKKKLQFVIDNWYTNALGDDMKRINYIITALYNEEDDEEVEILKEIEEDFTSFRKQNKASVNKVMAELKKIKLKVAQFEKS